MIDREHLIAAAAAYGIPLTPAQAAQLDGYAGLLVEKNKVMNLTAITDPQGVEVKHLVDSLLCAAQPEVDGRVADIGTGAGFPGVVLKILKPALSLTLIDATAKKLDFVAQSCAAIGLAAGTVHGRAEELARSPEYRERFDCVTARAVANLPALCEYCLPFVRVGGWFIAMKGPEAAAELAAAAPALRALGGECAALRRFTLPDSSERSLVILKKISQTPTKYPRSGKNITKKPIR